MAIPICFREKVTSAGKSYYQDTKDAQIRAMDRGEEGRCFNINYEQMGGFFTRPI